MTRAIETAIVRLLACIAHDVRTIALRAEEAVGDHRDIDQILDDAIAALEADK